ncbi:MAG: hypothetical protein UX26_C0007G0010 [Parcubacteria group bacterium GW2011_GWC1_45_9]|nr:MAG: hypothetical protein UW85_C0001G0031 [Parcubacteria group bacterium GW2011_GWA1_Parcubacteria_45_10]KKT89306.1 MAG: hypothetical protein UW89_C0001G0034 [Parcubacteria group bacterium GW2011_GWB1_45_10]KKU17122.1 MAG: hypothetical protein UX26_C0007G0010 [Parcubacteria group bacterium GW2011_GWC1_45_9]HCI05414.1 hypothetical protein [Patescibacteria group bacterium]
MTKIYLSVPHTLSWEEALSRRSRLAYSLFLVFGVKNLEIKWDRNAAEFSYWKDHKHKTKDSVSLAGVIAIAKEKVLVNASSKNGAENADKIAEKIKQAVKKEFATD